MATEVGYRRSTTRTWLGAIGYSQHTGCVLFMEEFHAVVLAGISGVVVLLTECTPDGVATGSAAAAIEKSAVGHEVNSIAGEAAPKFSRTDGLAHEEGQLAMTEIEDALINSILGPVDIVDPLGVYKAAAFYGH